MPIPIPIAIALVGLVVALGSWFVIAVDGITARYVARLPVQPITAIAAPLARAATAATTARTTTERPDLPAWALAPAMLAALAALALAMLPLAPGVAPADPDTGFVVFSAAVAFVMIAVFLHGWSPNSPMALHGAYRYGAQALSFQIPFLLAMLATALPAESLSLVRIVGAQADLWNVIRQPLGLPLYLVAGLSASFWGPFNLPDGADLAGGTSVEDSGITRALWSFARASMLLAVAALGASAFLGGYYGPVLPGPLWVLLKTTFLIVAIVAAGHLFARVRLERFVVVAWVVLIPLALLNVFVAGAFLL